jgi:hypothetical protein
MQDRRAGEAFEDHAIVLGYVPLKESDRLISLLTLEHGRIAAVAKGAAKSIKRFGAATQPMSYGKAQLQMAKAGRSSDSSLWILLSMESKSSFPHLRSSYSSLETAFFGLKLINDLVPEGIVDPPLFKALGRFLRDSDSLNFNNTAGWARVALWVWFAHHLGYGRFEEILLGRWADPELAPLALAFRKGLQQQEPDFLNVFKILSLMREQAGFSDLSLSEEALIYKRWVEVSSIHWDHFETWLSSKKSI